MCLHGGLAPPVLAPVSIRSDLSDEPTRRTTRRCPHTNRKFASPTPLRHYRLRELRQRIVARAACQTTDVSDLIGFDDVVTALGSLERQLFAERAPMAFRHLSHDWRKGLFGLATA